MQVLIADKLAPVAVEAITALGHNVTVLPDLKDEALAAHLEGVNILIVRSTRVTAETLVAASSLGLVIRAGAGTNTIDVAAAAARGIYVCNCPGRNKDAVAELAIGLMISADRRIGQAAADLREGRWRKKEYGKAHGLKGRTLGLLGTGLIGQAVIRRAKGLEMEVIAWSRSLTPARAEALGVGFASSPLDVARRADVVTVHLASTPETRHLVDAGFMAEMKEGAILVNTSRGDLVETAALPAAIGGRGLRVALDVFEGEPSASDAAFEQTELARLITGTPHIGASTEQASEAVAREAVRIVEVFTDTGKPPNVVNVTTRTPATHSLVVRHLNRVGVLAQVLASLRKQGINIEEMENTIFDGGMAACCTLSLRAQPTDETLAEIRASESILQVTLEARGAQSV